MDYSVTIKRADTQREGEKRGHFKRERIVQCQGQWDFYSAHYVEQDRVEGMEGCFFTAMVLVAS